MTRRIWWGDFTTEEFKGLDAERVIAILPVAAIEQHGPHLPVSTDFSIMQGMLATAIPLIPDGMDVRILPVQPVGKSNEHILAPGTLTIEATNLIRHWQDLGDSIARTGIRKLVIVNSHGGNEEIMGIVAREMRVRHAMLAVKTSWSRFGTPPGLFSETNAKYGIHGDDYETSLMLHFAPHLVHMEKAKDFRSRVQDAEGHFALLKHTGTQAFAWMAGDLNPAGVVGESEKATAAKGAAAAAHQAAGFVSLLRDVANAGLADWLSASS
ncbi:MAG: creatininase family protein [Rhizobiaceae bacterium]|nr:creatininase family protein [Rhizobiaceae bacterium]